ncbi:hypothetical protein [Streptomyces corynorhini]|uniref:Uncharacterized protein n=1 Tax=Streptomyces corynorhini TaxID=2282652 RepID=A0A370B5K6_9ACTN|nr:hypothetical protein [Streptomyces corynorhini]RDG35036.1 hypothetical protein DVH02_27445 [Streptomyces corynorhini]
MSHATGARSRFAGTGTGAGAGRGPVLLPGALAGALLAVLAVLAFCGHVPVPVAGAGPQAAPGVASGAVVEVEVVVTADGGYGRGTPGCGRGGQDDLGSRPVVPPRGGTGPELLPALYDAHGGGGQGSATGQTAASVPPERGRPPLPGPSPIGLSVLRV